MAGRLKFVRWDLDNLVEQVRSVCIIDAGGCWLWNYQGRETEWYPEIMIKRKRQSVSNWLLIVTTGETGPMALHTCDRPRCCNPDHLFWGTHQDNMRDMVAKGRANPHRNPSVLARGEKHGRSKLSESDVLAIRDQHASGTSMYRLAINYNVTKRCIQQIVRRETWTHL